MSLSFHECVLNKRQECSLLHYQGCDVNVSSQHSYMEDGLYGRDLVTQSSPVLWICIEALLQDVQLTAKARFLKGHPSVKSSDSTNVANVLL